MSHTSELRLLIFLAMKLTYSRSDNLNQLNHETAVYINNGIADVLISSGIYTLACVIHPEEDLLTHLNGNIFNVANILSETWVNTDLDDVIPDPL